MPESFVVLPVYYGLGFNAGPGQGSFTSDDMDAAIGRLCSSAYFDPLRAFDAGTVRVQPTGDVAPSSPPAAWRRSSEGFALDDVRLFLVDEINAGRSPSPAGLVGTPIYVATLEQGCFSKDEPGAAGYHFTFDYKGTPALCAWVMQGDDLDGTTPIVAHEIVEAAAQKLGNGEVADPCDQQRRINGVMAVAYADAHHVCVIPGVFEQPLMESLGGVWVGARPTALSNRDGRIEVFLVGTDLNLYHLWQIAPNNGWSGWGSLGGRWFGQDPVVTHSADGRIEIFIIGEDKKLYHRWQTAPSNGWSSGWESLGGSWSKAQRPAVNQNTDGRIEIFLRGDDKNLYHRWQMAPNSGWSSGWEAMGGSWMLRNPIVARNADGRMEIFILGEDNRLYHRWQTAPSNGWSSGWESLGGSWPGNRNPWAGQNADGRIEVFLRGEDDKLYHAWQTAPNNGWSGWAPMSGVWHRDGAVFPNLDGRLEAFVVGDDTQLYHCGQTAPNNGWSGWEPIGGPWQGGQPPSAVRNADGRLEVFVVGNDTRLYHAWQTAANGGWTAV